MWLGLCFTTKELLRHLARQAGLCPIAPSVVPLDAGSSAPLISGFLVGPWWFLGSFSRACCSKTFPLTSGFFQLWIQVLPVSLETALAIIPSTLVVTLHHSSLLKKKILWFFFRLSLTSLRRKHLVAGEMAQPVFHINAEGENPLYNSGLPGYAVTCPTPSPWSAHTSNT